MRAWPPKEALAAFGGFESRLRDERFSYWWEAFQVAIVYWVYVLHNLKDSTFYIGLTNNVQRRMAQHNHGYESTTRPHAPYQLLLSEEFATRQEARERENYYKSGVGRAKIRELLTNAEVAERQTRWT